MRTKHAKTEELHTKKAWTELTHFLDGLCRVFCYYPTLIPSKDLCSVVQGPFGKDNPFEQCLEKINAQILCLFAFNLTFISVSSHSYSYSHSRSSSISLSQPLSYISKFKTQTNLIPRKWRICEKVFLEVQRYRCSA